MDVPVSTLRAELKSWIERVGHGEMVVITERGVPVAQLTPVGAAGLIADLERDGLISPPTEARLVAGEADDRPVRRPHTPDAADEAMPGIAPDAPASAPIERRRAPEREAPLGGIMRRRRR